MVLRPAFFKPSLKLLVDRLPLAIRLQIVAQLETICRPVASAFIGGVIIGVAILLPQSLFVIAAIMLVCTAGWLVLGCMAIRIYRSQQTGVQDTGTLRMPAWITILLDELKQNTSYVVESVTSPVVDWFYRRQQHRQPVVLAAATLPTEVASICADSILIQLPTQTSP